MFFMFYEDSGLESVDVSAFDTSKVEDFKCMFDGCAKLKSLDLKHFDVRAGRNFSSMFYGCSSLESLDISGWTTPEATDLSGMFAYCGRLAEIDVSGFSTGKATNMGSMFLNCRGAEGLDVSGFDTSSALSMNYMFWNCSALESLELSGWDTSNVKEMHTMFSGCKALKSLDLSSFDMSKVTSSSSMLSGMDALGEIKTPKAAGTLSTPLPGLFCEKAADGSLDAGAAYNVLEEAPAGTMLYRYNGYTVIFCPDPSQTETATQRIERDADASLSLNTFTKEGFSFAGWMTYPWGSAADYADGETVRNIAPAGATMYLYALWERPRRFTFTIPAAASFTALSDGSFGAEIPYSISYTGNDADCVRVSATVGRLSDAFGNEVSTNCWNDKPTWFVMDGGGGTLNAETGCYEGTGVITVTVLSAYLDGISAGLYTGTLTVTVGFL